MRGRAWAHVVAGAILIAAAAAQQVGTVFAVNGVYGLEVQLDAAVAAATSTLRLTVDHNSSTLVCFIYFFFQ